MSRLDGYRVVVTGASSGIGAATAIAFAERGARLVLGARGAAGLEDVARRCREAGGDADFRVVDVTDPQAVARFAADAQKTLGGIDLWFSCAGVGVLGRFQDVPIDDHRRVVDINLTGHLNEVHALLPFFLAQDRGTWVNMISVGGYAATPYAAAYAASKFGLRGFSQALRGELSKHPRIHVCDVYPTFVDTPGIDHAGNYTGARLTLPPGSLAPETVAKAVVRLARHPRNSTFVGAPGIALELAQLLVPNLLAAGMNGFLDVWTKRAPPGDDDAGTLHEAPDGTSGPDGGRRHPERRRAAAIGVGVAAALGLGAAALMAQRKK